jgi:hypothetical protein
MPKISIAHADPVPLNSMLDRPRLKVVASAAIRRPVLTSGQFMRIPNLYWPTVCQIQAAATFKRIGQMTTRTHFSFRVDRWDQPGDNVLDHVANVEDFTVAVAAFEAACRRWPGDTITLRQGARIVEDSRKTGFA